MRIKIIIFYMIFLIHKIKCVKFTKNINIFVSNNIMYSKLNSIKRLYTILNKNNTTQYTYVLNNINYSCYQKNKMFVILVAT